MSIIDELASKFERFPGIGPRQSKRFVYFLLRQNKSYINSFANEIVKLSNEISNCRLCFINFQGKGRDGLCQICANKNRDTGTLMVVERDVDVASVEKIGTFNGLYFILGGTVDLRNENPAKYIRTAELKKRLESETSNINEMILATDATTEGDHTANFLKQSLAQIIEKRGVKVTTLGRGLSTGTELEYSDSETLRNALESRK